MPYVNRPVPGATQYFPLNDPQIGSPFPDSTHPQNKELPKLFQPITLRGTTFKNRIWAAPMCQYSSDNGHATDWHLVHIGSMAVRGIGAIIIEATAVLPEGRISPEDAGLWTDSQMTPLKRIVEFCHAQGTKIGIQLAHAGRKASTYAPWVHSNPAKTRVARSYTASSEENGWPDKVQGPSDVPFSDLYPQVKAMTEHDIETVKEAFAAATRRCAEIGFDFIELHGAHGYLIHSFVSPISNHRADHYGGSLENRIRFPLEVARAVRKEWPDKPLLMRISASDWVNGPEEDGHVWKQWGIKQSIQLCRVLQEAGIDMIDCSSGGNWVEQKIPLIPGYQVPFAESIKQAIPDLPVGTVGLITDPHQAEGYLKDEKADVVLFARELLRRADFALVAARELNVAVKPANQYERAWLDIQRPKL